MICKAKVDEAEWERPCAGRSLLFEVWRHALASGDDSRKLGCSLNRRSPEKRVWTRPAHPANGDALHTFRGRPPHSRIGVDTPSAVEAVNAKPDSASWLEIAGKEDLVYLCVSAILAPDRFRDPNAGKTGILAGTAPGGDFAKRVGTALLPGGSDVPHWTGAS